MCCVARKAAMWPFSCQDLMLRRCSLIHGGNVLLVSLGPLWGTLRTGLWVRASLHSVIWEWYGFVCILLYTFERVHVPKSSQSVYLFLGWEAFSNSGLQPFLSFRWGQMQRGFLQLCLAHEECNLFLSTDGVWNLAEHFWSKCDAFAFENSGGKLFKLYYTMSFFNPGILILI